MMKNILISYKRLYEYKITKENFSPTQIKTDIDNTNQLITEMMEKKCLGSISQNEYKDFLIGRVVEKSSSDYEPQILIFIINTKKHTQELVFKINELKSNFNNMSDEEIKKKLRELQEYDEYCVKTMNLDTKNVRYKSEK
jgi:hypothetical protein